MSTKQKRVLALDPTPKGFGWIVYEGPDRLLDWGLARIDPLSNPKCLERLNEFLELYPPDVVAIEDPTGSGSARTERVQDLLDAVERVASKRGIKVVRFSRDQIRKAFQQAGAYNKEQIASEIAITHRELARWLPRTRRVWMAEDHRMGIFDAASLAQTYFHSLAKRRRRDPCPVPGCKPKVPARAA